MLVVLLSGALSLLLAPETLRSIGGLPAHIVGQFEGLGACARAADGSYFVFDRRAHSVSVVPPSRDSVRTILQIGAEPGRILLPRAFDLADDGSFVVADAPGSRGRIQVFLESGASLGGFTLPGPEVPLIVLDGTVISGVGSLEYTGRSILMSRPESGALVSEYALDGRSLRSFGNLRPTGHEDDRALHLALNAGLVLASPRGGYYYVFVAGIPVFRKYDAAGTLVFERHIEGVELDEYVRTMPRTWPRRRTVDGTELPLVQPAVRTAAVDATGRLWISLTVANTYVYDGDGEKRRTVQFRAAGILSPTSLSFTPAGTLLATPGCFEFDPR